MSSPTIVISPCVSVCEMDTERGLCKGCLRTAEEIGTWRFATSEQRAEMLLTLRGRIADVTPDLDTTALEGRLKLAGV